MKWQAKVTINGPLNGRGVRQVKVGFVQNVTLTKLRATYAGVDRPRVSRLESATRKWLGGNEEGSAKPYFNSANRDSIFFNPTPDDNVKTIVDQDTPGADVPVLRNKSLVQEKKLDAVELVFNVDLYVVASTTDTRSKAEDVYAKQAEAVGGWTWNASQNLGAPNTYTFTPNPATNVTPPNGWRAVDDGTEPVKSRDWANTVYKDPRHRLVD